MGVVFLSTKHVLWVFTVCCWLTNSDGAISGILARRKPILNYLVRYKLGHIRSGLQSGLHSGLHALKHGVYPIGTSIYPTPYGEDHYHHFYLEPVSAPVPVPVGLHPLKSIPIPALPLNHGYGPHGFPPIIGAPIQAEIVHGKLAHSHFSVDAPFFHNSHKINYNNFHDLPSPSYY